ncbi:MAG: CDP-alcohol phosphatidyltransferase family protein [Polaribacter sp.]|uniref:CDP-alcohol phosphatidyltransferase family protein n=1 Tax=Polaribacter sp. TaxID=1920175 RepID=UPI002F356E2D
MKIQKLNTPQKLILFRFLLAPIILCLAYFVGEESKPIILILMYLGLISDILDGIVARKQEISTEKLRRLDSQTDMIFWLSIGFATFILFPNLIKDNSIAIWSILIMEIACYVISFLKFGKETCTHAFLSKIWGLTLLIAFTSLIGFNYAGIPFYIAIIWGLISHIDVILIILILPRWAHDIPSAYHAYLIRKNKNFKKNIFLNS